MLKLFKVELLAENGLLCDCCVRVSEAKADVYAKDEEHAKELIGKVGPYATVRITSLEDKGVIAGVEHPGVIIVSTVNVYSGHYSNSPLRTQPTAPTPTH